MAINQLEFEQVTAVNGPGEYRIARDPHPLAQKRQRRFADMMNFSEPLDAVEGTPLPWHEILPEALNDRQDIVAIHTRFTGRVNGRPVNPESFEAHWDGRSPGILAVRGRRVPRDHAHVLWTGPFDDGPVLYRHLQMIDKKGFVQESPPGVLHREDDEARGSFIIETAQLKSAENRPVLWKARLNLAGDPGALLVTALDGFNAAVKEHHLPLWKFIERD